ncbi:hypothetical protein SNE40_015975 [Patella caerulea]|uniref:Tetraspanin n=1 Tax=Patella caerulea TaxID=87958 RepID=A0AAN8JC35_PATCE
MGSISSPLAVIFRLLLIFLNIVFVLVGLIFMALGIVVKFFLGTILQSSLMSGTVKDIYDDISKDQPIPKNLEFGTFTNDAGLALIILGVILFGISVFACCGACYKWRPFLIIFCCLVIVLLLGEVTATGLLISKSSPVHDKARKELVSQLKNYNVDGSDGFSATFNLFMVGMKCCGVNGQDDFTDLALKYKGNSVTIPPACCKTMPDNAEALQQCQNAPTSDNSYTEGCYDAFLNLINSGNKWAIPVLVVIFIIQLLEVIFAAYVIRDIGKGSVGPV